MGLSIDLQPHRSNEEALWSIRPKCILPWISSACPSGIQPAGFPRRWVWCEQPPPPRLRFISIGINITNETLITFLAQKAKNISHQSSGNTQEHNLQKSKKRKGKLHFKKLGTLTLSSYLIRIIFYTLALSWFSFFSVLYPPPSPILLQIGFTSLGRFFCLRGEYQVQVMAIVQADNPV